MSMNKEKYFAELARRLATEGVDTERVDENSLAVSVGGQIAVRLDAAGNPFRLTGDPDMQSVGDHYYYSAYTAKMVAEYVAAVEESPPLVADDLEEGYKLLCEMNNAVLAAKETTSGYKFVTWERGHGGTSVVQGHYYGDNYVGAKEDFANRANLVNRNRLFTDEQLATIHAALDACLYEFCGDEKALVPIQRQIEHVLEDSGYKLESGEENMEMSM